MIMILWYVSSEKCVLPWELALCAICVPVYHTVCGLYGTCVALGSCVVCVSVLSVIATPSAYVVWTLALGVIPSPLSLLPSSSFPSYNMLFLSCPDQLQTFWWALWKLPGKSSERPCLPNLKTHRGEKQKQWLQVCPSIWHNLWRLWQNQWINQSR